MDTELGANNDVLVFGHGPRRVLITVALHGNEPCGVDAVNQVIRLEFVHELVCREFGLQPDPEYLKEYIFSQLTIIFLLGNPNAYLENKRYLKRNLNRAIADDVFKEESHEYWEYEHTRAIKIAHEIRKCDILLDIHSCSADSASFALPCEDPRSESLARILPVHSVIYGLAHRTREGGTTIDYALSYGKIAVCVECGQHSDPSIVETGVQCIVTLIYSQCRTILPPVRKQRLMRCMDFVVVTKGFRFAREFVPFELVEFGHVVCEDDTGTYACYYEQGAHIIMPSKLPYLGEEAFFWGLPLLE